jgi:hypothetical protein
VNTCSAKLAGLPSPPLGTGTVPLNSWFAVGGPVGALRPKVPV